MGKKNRRLAAVFFLVQASGEVLRCPALESVDLGEEQLCKVPGRLNRQQGYDDLDVGEENPQEAADEQGGHAAGRWNSQADAKDGECHPYIGRPADSFDMELHDVEKPVFHRLEVVVPLPDVVQPVLAHGVIRL